jgi:hypothetical protein
MTTVPASAGRRILRRLEQDQVLKQVGDAAGVGVALYLEGTALPPPLARLLRVVLVRRQIESALRRIDASRARRRRRAAVLAGAVLVGLVVGESVRGARSREAS